MFRCAVIGSPITHSRSPLLHQAAYLGLGIKDFRYDRFDVTKDRLGDFLAGLEKSEDNWVGLSVTAPLKRQLLAFGEAEELATRLQAGNTLIFGQPNRIYNTDVPGMVSALAARGIHQLSQAVILGNGATARSTLAALARLGIQRVQILARSISRARESLDELAAAFNIDAHYLSLGELPEPCDLLVNTIPVQVEASYGADLVRRVHAVFELTYLDGRTVLEKVATELGSPGERRDTDFSEITVLGPNELLVHQAIDQVELMTGKRPDASLMFAALDDAS